MTYMHTVPQIYMPVEQFLPDVHKGSLPFHQVT